VNVGYWQIVLQKSFCTADQKFSGLWMQFWNKYVKGPHRTAMNSPVVTRHIALAMSRHGELTLASRVVMQLAREVTKSSVGGLFGD
jgi:hypothetical protein